LYALTGGITSTPVIPCSNALFSYKEVLGVIDVFVGTGLDRLEDLSD
jgi:hypothetical protein